MWNKSPSQNELALDETNFTSSFLFFFFFFFFFFFLFERTQTVCPSDLGFCSGLSASESKRILRSLLRQSTSYIGFVSVGKPS